MMARSLLLQLQNMLHMANHFSSAIAQRDDGLGRRRAYHIDLRGHCAGLAGLGQVGHPGVALGGPHLDGAPQVLRCGSAPRDPPLALALLLRSRLRCQLPQARVLSCRIQCLPAGWILCQE